MDVAFRVCDAVTVLHAGKVVASGTAQSVRRDPTCFAVVPGHVVPDLEDVVDELGGRAMVVQKRAGDPAELARAHDPR